MSNWYLEGYLYQAEKMHRLSLDHFPFVIGRDASADLALKRNDISRKHCAIEANDEDSLIVRDLGSTNGTSVNGEALDGARLVQHGDVISAASLELRLIESHAEESVEAATVVGASISAQPSSLQGMREFEQMMQEKSVKAVFQAVFTIHGEPVAYEALGRGAHPGLPESPWQLFQLAESLGKAVDLSEVLREVAVQTAINLGAEKALYLNTHPEEMTNIPRLAKNLELLREIAPDLPFVIEIHEEGMTSKATMAALQEVLGKTYCKFAYDDFGAGRARLVELIEIPPELVKFDLSLIRDIDKASNTHLSMLTSLISLANDVGARTLAEGVETEAELAVCRELGVELIQGYLFGRPRPDLQQIADNAH